MKRMLASAITLVLLTAVLSGCATSQEPSEYQNSANDSMFMYIAETLPSCVAFEYREPYQKYCFYAYDTEGNFYRVIWDRWEELHEKDLIAVDYYGGIRKLTYDEYPEGGYTPQYEITAIRVLPERDVLASCLTHEGDGYTLTLPQSGKTLKLTKEQEYFIPYITDALVKAAEHKLMQDVSVHTDHSGFYLQINKGYLCLSLEVIRYLETSDEHGLDHEHLFYDEHISTQAVKAKEDPDKIAESSVIYCSGENKTYALSTLLGARQDNGDGTFTEITVDKYDVLDLVSGNTHVSMETIPTLLSDGSVVPLVPVNGEIERVLLLAETGDGFATTDTTFDALSGLEQGTYYVAVYIRLSGSCDPDAPQNSYRYEDVFRLEVK